MHKQDSPTRPTHRKPRWPVFLVLALGLAAGWWFYHAQQNGALRAIEKLPAGYAFPDAAYARCFLNGSGVPSTAAVSDYIGAMRRRWGFWLATSPASGIDPDALYPPPVLSKPPTVDRDGQRYLRIDDGRPQSRYQVLRKEGVPEIYLYDAAAHRFRGKWASKSLSVRLFVDGRYGLVTDAFKHYPLLVFNDTTARGALGYEGTRTYWTNEDDGSCWMWKWAPSGYASLGLDILRWRTATPATVSYPLPIGSGGPNHVAVWHDGARLAYAADYDSSWNTSLRKVHAPSWVPRLRSPTRELVLMRDGKRIGAFHGNLSDNLFEEVQFTPDGKYLVWAVAELGTHASPIRFHEEFYFAVK